jgi:hypothetical protein
MQAEPVLYARAITLRNCGRFLHVLSDFGSNYQTHAFLSSEMLHAGLGRERTRRPRVFAAAMDQYDFFSDFAIREWPVWFTPAMLIDSSGKALAKSRRDADVHTFNSLKEGVPGIQDNDKFPKFGTMETILPGRRFRTIAVSPEKELLEQFEVGQIFWMGKKRTMFQIAEGGLSDIINGIADEKAWQTPFIQVSMNDSTTFTSFEIVAATQRYMLMRGQTQQVAGWSFGDEGVPLFALVKFIESI